MTNEVLIQARKLLRAGLAEIVLIDETTGSCARRVRNSEGDLHHPADFEDPKTLDRLGRQTVWLQVTRGAELIRIPRGTACLRVLDQRDPPFDEIPARLPGDVIKRRAQPAISATAGVYALSPLAADFRSLRRSK